MMRNLTPQITVNTDDDRLAVAPPAHHRRGSSTSSMDTRANSFLTASSPLSPTLSIGGDTLRPPSINTSGIYDVSPTEALQPDAGTEADFNVENNVFAFTPGHMNKMLNPKSLAAYRALGGIRGIEKGLRTNLTSGISADETTFASPISFDDAVTAKGKTADDSTGSGDANFGDRLRIFKDNRLPRKKPTPLWKLMWLAYNDKMLLLLTGAAIVSLALGLYETFRTDKPHVEGEVRGADWIEGVAIICAIFIVVLVGSINDFQKEKQFVRLNSKKDDREVNVIRSGKSYKISVYDVLVGDIMHLEPGDLVPVDGIFIQGHNVKCDESSATGESDLMKKTSGDEAWRQLEAGIATHKTDPFIISGSKVLEGVGTFVVTSVGVNSSYGKIMMSLNQEAEPTPLQVKLNHLASTIAKLGGSAALFLFIVLFIRFLAGLSGMTGSAAEKASVFTDILIVAVTIVVVAIPEGLPLAVTLALAFATFRMLKEYNLVRVLKSCEIMGGATTICSDKTGTLTQNKMTVVSGTIGLDDDFDSPKSTTQLVERCTPFVKANIVKSIAINSTAFEGVEDGVNTFIGSKTETAMLTFARDFFGMGPVAEERSNVDVVQLFPFDSAKKCMGVVVRSEGIFRLYVKGASEILLSKSSHYLAASADGAIKLSTTDITKLEKTIVGYAEKSLRTIGMVSRDFTEWPPQFAEKQTEDPMAAEFDSVFDNMTFLGIVAIRDPLRDGVPQAVARCQNAGVVVRMVTGDNVVTAKAIATECGILTDGIVMEGPKFRQLSQAQMVEILPKLQVLARSSPEDKRILVTQLRELGETVAVTGDGTNDGPALKAADVGFSMGIAGTEVAKEASDIILLRDDFTSIVTALKMGRSVSDSIKKFLQFQLTVNITAVVLAFVSAVSSPEMHSVITAVQLLWVNLIMDTFAALALATDPPPEEILDRKPYPKSARLITFTMWKNIIGQTIFQLIVTFILYFAGARILGYSSRKEIKELETMVFNTFVWLQIFGAVNNRRLDNKFNIFERVHKNIFFLVILGIMIGGQILIIFIGGAAFSVVRIDGVQWAICIVLALISLLWAVVLRCIPDTFAQMMVEGVENFFRPVGRFFGKMKRGMRRKKNVKADEQPSSTDAAIVEEKKPDVEQPTIAAPQIFVDGGSEIRPYTPSQSSLRIDETPAPPKVHLAP